MIDVQFERNSSNSFDVRISNVCCAKLYVFTNGLYLVSFYTLHNEQRKGYGTQLLSVCKRISRRLNKPLRLTAGPFYNRPYDFPTLLNYYYQRGFRNVGTDSRDLEYRGN